MKGVFLRASFLEAKWLCRLLLRDLRLRMGAPLVLRAVHSEAYERTLPGFFFFFG